MSTRSQRCASEFFARDQTLRVVVTVLSGGGKQRAASEPLACGASQIDLTMPEPISTSGGFFGEPYGRN